MNDTAQAAPSAPIGMLEKIGGSAGARVSLLAAVYHPDVVSHLAILWITGGTLSLAMLAYHYCHDSMFIAERDGMEAVTELPAWKEPVERNPKNKQILLSQDRDAFVQKMKDWGAAFMAGPNEPVPGVSPAQLQALSKIPVMVFRGGKSDVHHPRETSEAVAKAIPGAKLVEPPWGDRERLDLPDRLRLRAVRAADVRQVRSACRLHWRTGVDREQRGSLGRRTRLHRLAHNPAARRR